MRISLYQWCTSTSIYSAPTKPWDGQPTFVNPGVDFFTPQSAVTAQGLNYTLKQLGANDTALLDLSGSLDANNWPNNLIPTGGALDGTHNGLVGYFLWDSVYGRWLIWIHNLNDSGMNEVWTTSDGGRSASKLCNVSSASDSAFLARHFLAVRNTDGLISAVYDSLGGVSSDCYTITPAGSVATHTAAGPQGSRIVNTWFAAGGVFVAIGQFDTTSLKGVYSSPDGTTWTDRTAASGMVSGTSFTGTNNFVRVAQSSTTMVVFSPVASVTTFVTTSNGTTTWSSLTSPIATGEQVQDVTWDAVNSLWLVLATDGTTSTLYKSSDLTTWTSAVISTSTTYSGIAASNGMYVAVAKGTAGSVGNSRAVYSTDKGVTWRWCLGYSLKWAFASSGAVDVSEKIVSNGQQFVAWNFDSANFSIISGQSPVAS